jgi:hypothetical protein
MAVLAGVGVQIHGGVAKHVGGIWAGGVCRGGGLVDGGEREIRLAAASLRLFGGFGGAGAR